LGTSFFKSIKNQKESKGGLSNNMSKKEKKTPGISRSEFLKDAGLLAGGAALGTTALLAGCTKEVTTTATQTTTATVTQAPAAEFTVYDINGAHEILSLFAARLGDLNGKKIAGLAADPTKWQTHRTFPYIFDEIKKKYPQAIIIPQTEFTMGTGINDDAVAKAVKDKGADACVIGNAA
jgi:hypothetical protein